jgi:hypothetical protein
MCVSLENRLTLTFTEQALSNSVHLTPRSLSFNWKKSVIQWVALTQTCP